MVGINGLGGIPEPKSERPANTKTERTDASASSSKYSLGSSDDVNISLEAKAAAELGRIVALTRTQDEIRAEKVEAAKQRLLAGSYRDPEVISKVAEKLLKFMA
jgi:anti-sigma28 factor (negative regulator of flagellin synthesis)